MDLPDEPSTSIDIDQDVLKLARRLTGATSDREIVGLALRTLIAVRGQPVAVERIISRRFDPGQIDAPNVQYLDHPDARNAPAMSDQTESLRILVAALGKHPVAAVFGTDARTIEGWLESGVRMKVEDERRLDDAFQVFSLIEEADDAEVARAWFLGMNPELDDDSPIEQLAAGNARAVLAAARSYVNAG